MSEWIPSLERWLGSRGELRPVLRPETFAAFDFDRSVAALKNLATALRKQWPALQHRG
jgi:hypothetical protein